MDLSPQVAVALTGLGGVLALDRTAFLQSLISRPLPTSALVGLVTGEFALALLTGLILELFWLSRQPVGGSVPPDETLAALASVLAALAAPAYYSPWEKAGAGVLVGLPYGLIGRWLEIRARNANGRLLSWTRGALEKGDRNATGKALALGAAHFLAAGLAGSLFAVLTAGPLTGFILGEVGVQTQKACALMAVALPVIGAGTLLGSIAGRQPKAVFLGGAVAGFAGAKLGLAGLGALFTRGRG